LFNLASYIDYTLLKPTCTYADIKKLCQEAIQYKFAAVCVPPFMVSFAKEQLTGTHLRLATVVGFPFGYQVADVKLVETRRAIDEGADELDIVINLSALKSGSWTYLENEMEPLVGISHDYHKLVKVIIETGVLTDDEIIRCCQVYGKLGVDFLKTSTGYAEKGATLEAVKLIRKNAPGPVRIKASGGIRDFDFARQLIEAGAERIGTSRILIQA